MAVESYADGSKLSPLANVSATRAVLEAHGLATKHSLGQNFLINDSVLAKIVKLAKLEQSDYVLEVGPGIGTLSIALLKNAGRVVAVERDTDLPAVLRDTLAPWAQRFQLVQKDALDLQLDDIVWGTPLSGVAADGVGVAADSSNGVGNLPCKLVANLPYAVAATVVLDFFERFDTLQSATVMVQKEVADRMSATPGNKNYGAYTVKLNLFAKPAGRFSVGPNNFFPPPRVESSVLRLDRVVPLDPATGQPLTLEVTKAACMMADASFASRRKTIANSCKTYFGGRQTVHTYAGDVAGSEVAGRVGDVLEAAGIDPRRRGETLNQVEFIGLAHALLELTF